MKLRSGKITSCTVAPKRRSRKRKTPARRAPVRTVEAIVQRAINGAREKKRFDVGRSLNANKRVLSQYQFGTEIVTGAQSFNRVGETATVTRIAIKYRAHLNAGSPTTDQVRIAPVYLKLFIVRSTRTDDPRFHWFQGSNTDGNLDFNTFPSTPAGDTSRLNARLNSREIKVLARKTIIIGGRSSADPDSCACKVGTITTKKLNMKLHWNVGTGDVAPYGRDRVQPCVYFIWYACQPDGAVGVDTGEIDFNWLGTMYYQE